MKLLFPMKLLFRLTSRNISVSQILAFAAANLLGLLLIMLAMQAYRDVLPLFSQEDGVVKPDYIVLSKPVSTLGSVFQTEQGFSEKEIAEIREQRFVSDIGVFTPSQFQVTVVVNIPGTSQTYASEMFFEAVPDRYVDVDLKRWKYDPQREEIPIILPRNYLNLYNFGFAQTKGLPKISEQMISMLPLKIYVARKGQAFADSFTAHICGFSNRLNTILVPEAFIKEANRRYSDGEETLPSRIIIKVNNPADSEIATYLEEHHLQAEQDNVEAGRLTWLLRLIVFVIIAIGAVVCALSFYLLMLSIFLLVQKNREKIKTLRLIGFSVNQVAMPYFLLTIGTNVTVFLVAVLLMNEIRGYYLSQLSQIYPQIIGAGVCPTIAVVVILLFAITVVNSFIIRHNIDRMMQ